MITVRKLNKTFKKQRVLKDIDVKFSDTGLVFILGPSGCGKTTFLNCLSGLIDYDGEIYLDNTSLNRLGEKEKSEFRMRRMGFVFQDFKLFSFLTVGENIAFTYECSHSGQKIIKKRKIKDLLEIVGLSEKETAIVKNLSGGQKQRVAIARAIVNNPDIVLCDEPTGSLDSNNSKKVMDILKIISRECLVIVVSHDEDLAKEYASQIIYMKDGEINKTVDYQREESKKHLILYKESYTPKKTVLSLSFLKNHTKSCLKNRKFRSLMTNFITSMGLIGVGMSIVLSDTISSNIVDAYSTLISANQIIATNKEEKASNYVRKSWRYHPRWLYYGCQTWSDSPPGPDGPTSGTPPR